MFIFTLFLDLSLPKSISFWFLWTIFPCQKTTSLEIFRPPNSPPKQQVFFKKKLHPFWSSLPRAEQSSLGEVVLGVLTELEEQDSPAATCMDWIVTEMPPENSLDAELRATWKVKETSLFFFCLNIFHEGFLGDFFLNVLRMLSIFDCMSLPKTSNYLNK